MKKKEDQEDEDPEASKKPRQGPSRRDFFVTSGAVIGAAGLAAGCGPANARSNPTPPPQGGPSWTLSVPGPFVYDHATMIEQQAGTMAFVHRLEFESPMAGTSQLEVRFEYSGPAVSTRIIRVDLDLKDGSGLVLTSLSRVTTDGRLAAAEIDAQLALGSDTPLNTSGLNYVVFDVDETVAAITQSIQITLTEL
jgi:hypothetical protein